MAIRNIIMVITQPSHSKTRPFANRTTFDHLNTGLVRYSDGYCLHFRNSNCAKQCLRALDWIDCPRTLCSGFLFCMTPLITRLLMSRFWMVGITDILNGVHWYLWKPVPFKILFFFDFKWKYKMVAKILRYCNDLNVSVRLAKGPVFTVPLKCSIF